MRKLEEDTNRLKSGKKLDHDSGLERIHECVEDTLENHEKFVEWCYYEYWLMIYLRLIRLLQNSELAKEMTQETFTRLTKHAKNKSRNRIEHPKQFIFKIANNLYCDHIKKNNRDPVKDYLTDDNVVNEDVDGIEQLIQLSELERALSTLPPHILKMVLLRYFDELTYRDIGKLCDKNPVTVQQNITKALARLRKEMSRD